MTATKTKTKASAKHNDFTISIDLFLEGAEPTICVWYRDNVAGQMYHISDFAPSKGDEVYVTDALEKGFKQVVVTRGDTLVFGMLAHKVNDVQRLTVPLDVGFNTTVGESEEA